ncbi:MAG: alpha/beta fold hydrolase [Ilumatobacter sp.]|nr:alpha/beta fold hydrolase [Ilumatobacter sp.]
MVEHRFETVTNGDVDLRVAVAGEGPLMLFVHGWPELWYSWRHQMTHFADRFTVAAMDVRGYGGSSKPPEVERYTLRELAGDAAAVIDALSDDGAAIAIGHDWGAPIVYQTARLHPDRVSAVAGLSVPYRPVGPVSAMELWEALYPDRFFYMRYFQPPGIAEAELSADHARSLRMIWYSASADGRGGLIKDKPRDATMLDGLIDPDPFPAWSTPEDQAVYAEAFEAGGWTGPLNRYRAQGLDAEQLGTQTEPRATIGQPAAFIGGELDPVRNFVQGVDVFADSGPFCDDFRGGTIVPGAGHWVQQEAPAATNAALDEFVSSL